MKFKYDLHVHTKELSACARLSMEEIIDEYIKKGYAGLIITDHFRKCKDEKEDYLENKFMIEMNLEDFYNKFKNKAIIIQAHPHRKKHSKLSNLNPKHNNNNHLTQKVYEENPHLIATGGSDVHKREDLCRGGIYTNRKINSDEDFLEILKNKAFEVI